MAYKIQLADHFTKRYSKLTQVERGMVDDKLVLLAENPGHPSLRMKKIQGTSEYEVSVNMDIRMAIAFEGDRMIIMLDVGHHDKLLKRRSARRQ